MASTGMSLVYIPLPSNLFNRWRVPFGPPSPIKCGTGHFCPRWRRGEVCVRVSAGNRYVSFPLQNGTLNSTKISGKIQLKMTCRFSFCGILLYKTLLILVSRSCSRIETFLASIYGLASDRKKMATVYISLPHFQVLEYRDRGGPMVEPKY